VFLLFCEEMGFSWVIRGPLWLSPTTWPSLVSYRVTIVALYSPTMSLTTFLFAVLFNPLTFQLKMVQLWSII
jgi:hypothetical protein